MREKELVFIESFDFLKDKISFGVATVLSKLRDLL